MLGRKNQPVTLVSTMSGQNKTKAPENDSQFPLTKLPMPKRTTDHFGRVMLVKQAKAELPSIPRANKM